MAPHPDRGEALSVGRATEGAESVVQVDFKAREITIKIVYYGPALSGKTTNLHALHERVSQEQRTRLMTLETRDDRTLFFDLLPMTFKHGDLSLRFKVFTVPGQVMHNATRRLVLQGADGVAFIADSQLAETRNNAESFLNLRDNLKQQGMDITHMPVVIQFNKRDLPAVRSDNEIAALAKKGREPVFRAVAVQGEGVAETFVGLLDLVFRKLEVEADFAKRFGVTGDALVAEVCERLQLPPEYRGSSMLGGQG
jgi:signal recognition particle receptor subunit beta